MNRQRFLKITAIVAGVVVALLVVLSILVKVLISPELVKRAVLPRISAAVKRQVTLGDVSVSIFSGIRLHDLVIQDKDGTQPFLKAGALRLNYRFWPLLARRVEIKDIRLEAPLLRVVRYADGTFNFSDLKANKGTPPPEETAKSPINLAVSRFDLTDGTVIFEDRPGGGGKPYMAEISAIRLTAEKISLNDEFPLSMQARLPGEATLDIFGTASRVGSEPNIALTTALMVKDLAKLAAAMPPAVAEKAQKLSLAGGVELRLKLAGGTKTPKQLLQGGEIKLSSVQVTAGKTRPSLSGLLLLGKDSLEGKNLQATIGGQKLDVGLNVTSLMAKPANLSLDIQGNTLDLNQLLPPAGAKPAAAAAPKEESAPLNLPLVARGTARFSSVLYRTLDISNLSIAWKLADNVFVLDSMNGAVAGGRFNESARINLGVKGFDYRSQLTVQGVQADKLVPAFAPKAAGTVFGTMGLSAQLQGSGTLPESIKRNLGGQGDFVITDGKLTGSGFMQELAGFLKADQLRVLGFSRYAGTFGIRGGVVNLNSELNGGDARIKTAGTADFDKRLNMSLDTRLSPKITGQIVRGDAGRFLTDNQGWGVLPLKVGGSVGSPSFSVDASMAGAQLKGKLQEELVNRMPKGKQGKEKRPEQQLIEQGLKGIFGN